MNTDIRVAVSFRDHWKRADLCRRLGDGADSALINLWLYAAESRPNGDLSGLSNSQIAHEARWRGDPDAFVKALIASHFLDRSKRNLMLHDWHEHNFFASNAENRKFASRKANHIKFLKNRGISCQDSTCPYCDRSPVGDRVGDRVADPVATPKTQHEHPTGRARAAFAELFTSYPHPDPCDEGDVWNLFVSAMQSDDDVDLCARALRNYLENRTANGYRVRSAKKWFAGEWREWIDWKQADAPTPPTGKNKLGPADFGCPDKNGMPTKPVI